MPAVQADAVELEWMDYPWEMGLYQEDIFDRKGMEALLRAGGGLDYAYILWRKKNGNIEPFYVGKGRGKRVATHGTKSDDRHNPIKNRIMDKALKDGWVGYSLRFFDSAEKALAKEAEWVECVGTISNKTGPLSNLKEGGMHGGGQKGMVGAANHMSIPVFVNGVKYESMSQAGIAHNICVASVRHRCERSLWPEWVMEGIEKIQCKGVRRTASPVSVEGVIYKNCAEAAKYLNMHKSGVRYRCESPSFPGWFKLLSPQKIRLKPKHKKISVLAEGKIYESITAAARAYGMSVTAMRFRCEDARYKDFEYRGPNKCQL